MDLEEVQKEEHDDRRDVGDLQVAIEVLLRNLAVEAQHEREKDRRVDQDGVQ